MKKKGFFIVCFGCACFTAAAAWAGESAEAEGRSIDWFQWIVSIGYLVGMFVLFPVVVYTAANEKIKLAPEGGGPNMRDDLSEEERNEKARELLEEVEARLSVVEDEGGAEAVTITSGAQARFTKNALDYICTRLCPTEEALVERTNEFIDVYTSCTQRFFSGSKWIIGCALFMIIFMAVVDLSMFFTSFTVIQLVSIAFYYLASKTPVYVMERRLERYGGKGRGVVGGVLVGLIAGLNTKHFVSVNGGPWERDYESEFGGSMFTLFIVVMAAFFIAVLIALFGILSFVMNYSTSFLLPFRSVDKWYEENSSDMEVLATELEAAV